MNTEKDFSYYTFNVGRYLPNSIVDTNFKKYEPDTQKLIWNVFVEDFNAHSILPVNLFEYNWVFLKHVLYAKKHYSKDFDKFADYIRGWLSHEYWSRSEYETIICGWPSGSYLQEDLDALQAELNKVKEQYNKNEYVRQASISIPYPAPHYKMDVYTQVMMNWDRFIEYLWANKKLITEKKLGLNKD